MTAQEEGTAIVVPCFNEELRWSESYWEQVARGENLTLFFVNDGSSDLTGECIEKTAAKIGARILTLPANKGKSEAVRLGMLEASKYDFTNIGFLDADGAFPASEVLRLASRFSYIHDEMGFDSLWSSRVKLAGHGIHRDATRHYMSRVILTLLALKFKFDVYDTQSGYKLFRASEVLIECLSEPFHTKWFVDLEILLRWRKFSHSEMKIWEEPVLEWIDVKGSKLSGTQNKTVIQDLFRLSKRY